MEPDGHLVIAPTCNWLGRHGARRVESSYLRHDKSILSSAVESGIKPMWANLPTTVPKSTVVVLYSMNSIPTTVRRTS
jgi:hypothetical protein